MISLEGAMGGAEVVLLAAGVLVTLVLGGALMAFLLRETRRGAASGKDAGSHTPRSDEWT
jgi:hypothetical protein